MSDPFGVRESYDAGAAAWAAGPDLLYRQLGAELVAASPVRLAGSRVLDLGAGAGAVGRAARRLEAALVVGVDLSAAMLEAGTAVGAWSAAAVADAVRLPFGAGAFDLVLAACCLGHVPDPGAALREARRVAPALVASAFDSRWTHPAKSVVDGVAQRYGFVAPPWYQRLEAELEPRVDDPDSLARLAAAAGFRRVDVQLHHVAAGLSTPGELVAWRLGMAHLAPFVAGLDADTRADLAERAAQALEGSPPLVVPLLVLTAR